LTGHKSKAVSSLAFSPDGTRLASSGADCTARLWNLVKEECQLLSHARLKEGPRAVAFAPDGTLAVLDASAIGLLSPLATELEVRKVGRDGRLPLHVQFSPDGKILAMAGYRVRLWDTASRRQLPERKEKGWPTGGLAFAPDEAVLATAHSVWLLRKK